MYKTIDSFEFIKAFEDCGRENQFSREALFALFDYLEQFEQDTEEDMELDVIGLCCDFIEYESLEAFNEDCGTEYATIEDLEDETQVIQFDGGIIVQNF